MDFKRKCPIASSSIPTQVFQTVLQKKIVNFRQRCDDLYGELDASLDTNTSYRTRLDESAKNAEKINSDLKQSSADAQKLADEKHILTNEIERLKGFIMRLSKFT